MPKPRCLKRHTKIAFAHFAWHFIVGKPCGSTTIFANKHCLGSTQVSYIYIYIYTHHIYIYTHIHAYIYIYIYIYGYGRTGMAGVV